MKIKLNSTLPTINSIENAKQNFSDIIQETPLEYNQRLSQKYNCKVFLKREDKQIVRSYKIRGAFNSISNLSQKERKQGIVCASAGNHAQAVAFICNYLKIKGTIFMPKITPLQKIKRTKKFGGKYIDIRLIGETFNEASKITQKFSKKRKAIQIHAFNDLRTITGQGTMGVEILKNIEKHIDYLIVPVGGGGLISGVGTYFKGKSPKTKIIGVESVGCASMSASLSAKRVVELKKIDSFADGTAISKVGENTFKIAKKIIKKIIKIPENRICSTILDFLNEEGIILEPAGALAPDALKDLQKEIKGKTVVCILSGGNLDFNRLDNIKERKMLYYGTKKSFMVRLPNKPRTLKNFVNCLGPNDNLVKFQKVKAGGKWFDAIASIETNDKKNVGKLIKKLKNFKIKFRELENDSLF